MTSALITSPARAGHVDGLRKVYRDAGTMLSSLGPLSEGNNIEEGQCNRNSMSKGKSESLKPAHGYEHLVLAEKGRMAKEEVIAETERRLSMNADSHRSTIMYPSLAPLTDAGWETDCKNIPPADGSPDRRFHNHHNIIPTWNRKSSQMMMTQANLSRPFLYSAEQQSDIYISSDQNQKLNRADSGDTTSKCFSAASRNNNTYLRHSLSPPSPSTLVNRNIPVIRASSRSSTRQAPPASASTPPHLRQISTSYPVHHTYPIYSHPTTPNTPRTRNSRASRFTVIANAKMGKLTYEPPKPCYEAESDAELENKKMIVPERDGGEGEEGGDGGEEVEEEALKELSPNVEIYRKGRARRKGRRRIFGDEEEEL